MYFRNAKIQTNNEVIVTVYFEVKISRDGAEGPPKVTQMTINGSTNFGR